LNIHTKTLIVLLTLMAAGCATTPTGRWAQQREALTEAEKQLTLNARLGNLSPADIRLADVGVKTARAALADAEQYLPNGGREFTNDLSIVQSIVARLTEFYVAKKLPATQPAP
jgi:hypothetical protein